MLMNTKINKERALLVVDMTYHFLNKNSGSYIGQAEKIMPFIRGEIKYFRERDRPVIFAHTQIKGNLGPNNQLWSSSASFFKPREREKIIEKKSPSAFLGTNLDETLKNMGIKRLILVGVATDTSILLTAADGIFRGYEVIVPETCVACSDQSNHEYAFKLIQETWKNTPLTSNMVKGV